MTTTDRRRTFDEVADQYGRFRPGYPEALVDDVAWLADLPAGGRILEIGSGTGKATVAFAARGYRMTCIELGPHLAAIARRKLLPYPQVEVEVTAFEDWPAPAAAFDLVMAAQCFHFLDAGPALHAIAATLRPGSIAAMPTTLLSALPAFVVPDVRAAVVHYTEVLGFGVPDHFRDADEFAIVDLAPGQGIHLKRGRGAPVQGAFVLLTPAEQERLAADLGRRGADIRASLAMKPWGMREMTVVDHVGHRLRVAAEDGPGGQPQVWPEIPVADVAAAVAFSREVLGFEPIHTAEYQGQMVFAAAGRDGARVHWTPAEISPRNRARAGIWDLCIEARGVDALAAELAGWGASVVRGPVTTGYGIRELEIAGPDGCTICFGEDLGG